MVSRLDTSASHVEDAAAAIVRNFPNSAGCSMEQIFSPVSIFKDGNSLPPGFRPNVSLGNDIGLFSEESVGPTIRELNPYFPANIIDGDTDGSIFFSECDYNAVVMDPSNDLSRGKHEDLTTVSAVRTKGLRAPLILSGWGFDLCDTPVPYVPQGEKRVFDVRLVNDRRYWKTGPLHVMWDEERQVWSGGPQIVVGESLSNSTNGTREEPQEFRVKLLRAGNSPEVLTEYNEVIVCKNRDPNLTIEVGQWVVAARINYEWIAIQAGGGSSVKIGNYRGSWNKNEEMEVTQLFPEVESRQEGGDVRQTHTVQNLFGDVGSSGSAYSKCAYVKVGEEYYLIASECV
jgi:hypothetical protein